MKNRIIISKKTLILELLRRRAVAFRGIHQIIKKCKLASFS
ncbi:hypothetical protein ACFLT8_00495 [Chloroflexota bacterium]